MHHMSWLEPLGRCFGCAVAIFTSLCPRVQLKVSSNLEVNFMFTAKMKLENVKVIPTFITSQAMRCRFKCF